MDSRPLEVDQKKTPDMEGPEIGSLVEPCLVSHKELQRNLEPMSSSVGSLCYKGSPHDEGFWDHYGHARTFEQVIPKLLSLAPSPQLTLY